MHGDLILCHRIAHERDQQLARRLLGAAIRHHYHWSELIGGDVVITMGCGDACPVFPGKRYLDWELPDPAGLPLEKVRPIRDEIERRIVAC